MEDNGRKKGNKQIDTSILFGTIMDGIQQYVLGTKKNGEPRAVYDIIKDYTVPKKKKKHKKKNKYNDDIPSNTYELYLSTKKKKKKHKKKNKHWHI